MAELPARWEDLRRALLARPVVLLDAVIEQCVMWADVQIEHDVARWPGSGGTVSSHAVWMGVTPELLGRFLAKPGSRDKMCEALAAEIANAHGHGLRDMELYWSLDRVADAQGYRTFETVTADRADPRALCDAMRRVIASLDAPYSALADAVVSASWARTWFSPRLDVRVRPGLGPEHIETVRRVAQALALAPGTRAARVQVG